MLDFDVRVMNSRWDEQREGNHSEQQCKAVKPDSSAVAPPLSIRPQREDLIGFAEAGEEALDGRGTASVV
ncbi:MAG: hypothetical protein ABFS46_18035 [Myxococcota bacterium]